MAIDRPMTTAPNRRWFRWSLQTMFVVVTAFACWLGYELNWIKQRHELLTKHQAYFTEVGIDLSQAGPTPAPRAPGLLWLFGERGHAEVDLLFLIDKEEDRTPPEAFPDVRLAKRLFPEAEIEAAVFSRDELKFEFGPFPVLPQIITKVREAVQSVVGKSTTTRTPRNSPSD
jgi:hypothetical protein